MIDHRLETLAEIFGLKSERNAQNNDLFSRSINSQKVHDVYRLTTSDDLNLPHIVVAGAGDTEDFFALVATYYQDKSPITSLIHVLGKETKQLLPKIENTAPSSRDSKIIRLALLGAAIGEATIAGLGSPDSISSISYAACRRTLSFILCRTNIIHNELLSEEFIANRWATLRLDTGLAVSTSSVETIKSIYRLFIKNKQNDFLSAQLAKCIERKEWSRSNLDFYFRDLYPEILPYIETLSGPFDGRLSGFTKIVKVIQQSSRGLRDDEIAVAYFLNSIQPGSYNHSGVLIKLIDFYPTALIWYGFFASLYNIDSDNRINPSLMNKLDRDLIEPFTFWNRPKCDISFEELRILSRGGSRLEQILPSHQRALLVSLAPGVDVYTRYGFEADSSHEKQNKELEVEEITLKVTQLLEEALINLKKVSGYKKVFSSQNYSSSSVKRKPRKDYK